MSGTFIDEALSTIPQDKQLHALWLFFGSTILLSFGVSIAGTAILALVVIAIKEVLDGATNTPKEHILDASAGVVGLIFALALHMVKLI